MPCFRKFFPGFLIRPVCLHSSPSSLSRVRGSKVHIIFGCCWLALLAEGCVPFFARRATVGSSKQPLTVDCSVGEHGFLELRWGWRWFVFLVDSSVWGQPPNKSRKFILPCLLNPPNQRCESYENSCTSVLLDSQRTPSSSLTTVS